MAAVILAGDIGGTKTHLGLYRADETSLKPIRDRIYQSRAFVSLAEACADFLGPGGERIAGACFGVPGPVIEGEARATNIAWEMREDELARALAGVPVRLINDLAAAAYGALHLEEAEVVVLQPGQSPPHQANLAVIAAGTGLGEAALVFERGEYHMAATESGHADFAPRNAEQWELHQFLAAEFGHVSVERAVSGPGIYNIYRFLRRTSLSPEPAWLAARFKNEDPGAVVSEAALARRDGDCVRALEMFVDLYGAEAGNLALRMLALGGVYIAGGIAPKVLPMLKNGRFLRAFCDKGRLHDTLGRIEVRVVLNQGVGLRGAAHCAAAMLMRV